AFSGSAERAWAHTRRRRSIANVHTTGRAAAGAAAAQRATTAAKFSAGIHAAADSAAAAGAASAGNSADGFAVGFAVCLSQHDGSARRDSIDAAACQPARRHAALSIRPARGLSKSAVHG